MRVWRWVARDDKGDTVAESPMYACWTEEHAALEAGMEWKRKMKYRLRREQERDDLRAERDNLRDNLRAERDNLRAALHKLEDAKAATQELSADDTKETER